MLAAVEAVGEGLNLLVGFSFVLRLVILQMAHLRAGSSGHENLRQMVLRFDQVELRFVSIVVVGNILIGDVDLRRDLLIQNFLDGKRAAEIALKVILVNFLFLDRKSTRLNSSHANISYAVFCLK